MGCNVSKASEAIAEDKAKTTSTTTGVAADAAATTTTTTTAAVDGTSSNAALAVAAEKKEGDEDFDVEKFRRANHRATTDATEVEEVTPEVAAPAADKVQAFHRSEENLMKEIVAGAS